MYDKQQKLTEFHEALDAAVVRSNGTRRNEGSRVSKVLTEMANRFLALSPGDVSDIDLVAVLLAGSTTISPREAAEEALSISQQDLARVIRAEQLHSKPGYTSLSVARLIAAGELSRRAGTRAQVSGIGEPITDSMSAATIFRNLIGGPLEKLAAVYVDSQNRVMGMRVLSVGSSTATVVSPSEILRAGIEIRAKSFFIAHNHPSGNPAPSNADIQVTRALVTAGKAVELYLLDHVILGAGREYTSLKESGII